MKMILFGILLGVSTIGTVGSLYRNTFYSKKISKKEIEYKFQEIKSKIEKFSKDFDNKNTVAGILVEIWMTPRELKGDKHVEGLKEMLEKDLDKNKKEILKHLYEDMELFIKLLIDNGIEVSEYYSKVVSSFVLLKESLST